MLTAALANGITPFLDLILSSPHATLDDVAVTLREAYRWLREGCEIGMYPYVIPFSGAVFAKDSSLLPHTHYAERHVAGTKVTWQQPAKILPVDPLVAQVVLRMEHAFETMLADLEKHVAHLPSRVRSLVWILCSLPIMAEKGHSIAEEGEVRAALYARLPAAKLEAAAIAAEIA
jgi:hypothetical protein